MFEGKVIQVSHERGLLVSFEGSSPALGSTIVDYSGNILGRVETVLGNINDPLVHIHPIKSGVIVNDCIGKSVKIRSRNNEGSRDSAFKKRDYGKKNTFRKREGGRNNDNRRSDRKSNLKPGDWRCSKCNYHNYASKQVCNKPNCNEKKPRGNNSGRDSSRGRNNSRGRDSSRGRNNNRGRDNHQKRNSNKRNNSEPKKHFKDRNLKNVFTNKND